MVALSLSLFACLGWGIADFLGGLKSRQLPTITILMTANFFGIGVLGIIVLVRGVAFPGHPDMAWAILAGLVGIVAMLMLYRAMAIGSISIVAPISAAGVIIPVVLGIGMGDPLTRFQLVGIIAAIAGTILAARERSKKEDQKRMAKGVDLAIGAAITIGLFFVFMDKASDVDPYWAAFLMRSSYSVFLLPFILIRRPSLKVKREHYPAIILMGVIDALAAFSFAMATKIGLLSMVSVIGALYPVVTIGLSLVILKERPQKIQAVGIVFAIIGAVLISSG